MLYYIFYYTFLIFTIFIAAYRIDADTPWDDFILKKIKLKKKTMRFFLCKNKSVGILNASLIMQCFGYLCIPIGLIAMLYILINNYEYDKVVSMLFCMAVIAIIALAGFYSTIILIISIIMNRKKKK